MASRRSPVGAQGCATGRSREPRKGAGAKNEIIVRYEGEFRDGKPINEGAGESAAT